MERGIPGMHPPSRQGFFVTSRESLDLELSQ